MESAPNDCHLFSLEYVESVPTQMCNGELCRERYTVWTFILELNYDHFLSPSISSRFSTRTHAVDVPMYLVSFHVCFIKMQKPRDDMHSHTKQCIHTVFRIECQTNNTISIMLMVSLSIYFLFFPPFFRTNHQRCRAVPRKREKIASNLTKRYGVAIVTDTWESKTVANIYIVISLDA